MNKLQKAGCIGALVAGMLSTQPAYAQQPNSYDLKPDAVAQKEKAEEDTFKTWAYCSIVGAAVLIGVAYLFSIGQNDQ